MQAESTDVHFQESIRSIPSSEGLLITSNTNTIAPSIGHIKADPSSQRSGLKLLQLQVGRKRDKNRTKGVSSTPKRLIRFSHSTQTESPPLRSFRPQNPTSDVTHGLRLLHLQSGAQGHINLPKTHSAPLPKHFFLPAVPLGETPKLQLLHIDPKPTRVSIFYAKAAEGTN